MDITLIVGDKDLLAAVTRPQAPQAFFGGDEAESRPAAAVAGGTGVVGRCKLEKTFKPVDLTHGGLKRAFFL